MNFYDFSQKPPARGAPIWPKVEQFATKVCKSNFFAKGRRDWDSRLVTIVKIKVSEQTIAKKQKLRCERTPTGQNWSKRGAILEQKGALFAENSAKLGAPVTDEGQTDLDHPAPRAWSFKARWQTSALAPQLQPFAKAIPKKLLFYDNFDSFSPGIS